MEPMTFEKWLRDCEREFKRPEDFRAFWDALVAAGADPDLVAQSFNAVAHNVDEE